MQLWGSRRRSERGAAAVETALVLCFLVLPLMFGTISYAYMLAFRQTVSQSAAEGARAAAVAPQGTSDELREDAARSAVDRSMSTGVGGLECGQDHLVCSFELLPNCDDGSPGSCMRVTVSYPYKAHPLLPSVPGLGLLLPTTVSYAATATVS